MYPRNKECVSRASADALYLQVCLTVRRGPEGSDESNEQLAQVELSKMRLSAMSQEVKHILAKASPRAKSTVEDLELAGQLLEDSLGDILKWILKGLFEQCDKEDYSKVGRVCAGGGPGMH